MRSLTNSEVRKFNHVDRAIAIKARLVKVPWLTPHTSGTTIGRFIFLRPAKPSDKLIAHELVHVRQYDKKGVVRFLLRYVLDYFKQLAKLRNHRAAYLAIPTEVEARADADAWSRHNE